MTLLPPTVAIASSRQWMCCDALNGSLLRAKECENHINSGIKSPIAVISISLEGQPRDYYQDHENNCLLMHEKRKAHEDESSQNRCSGP